jgi:hypothetical protein
MDNETVDFNEIDARYENLRLKDSKVEKILLSSISEKGILSPILGVFKGNRFILVDGFKRYRCCKKLHIGSFPFQVLGENEADGILNLLKTSNEKSLHILEQAQMIDELHKHQNLQLREIALVLEKSLGWVSVRFGILKDMSDLVREKIFSGAFPARVYLYSLQPFTRVNKAPKEEIEKFVNSTSNKRLSAKDIHLLAQGYFKGGQDIKDQIEKGHFTWVLSRIKDYKKNEENLSIPERSLQKDLEIVQKYIGRLVFKLPDFKKNDSFMSTAGLLAQGILNKLEKFREILIQFGGSHD